MKYKDIRIGMPSIDEEGQNQKITPHFCRLRNITYSATIFVDIEYTLGDYIKNVNDVKIGKMPIMLGSTKCWLSNKSINELSEMYECQFDPRGYFIIKGVEKVILIQEQQSKNRIIIEKDKKGLLIASVTSSTHETKSKATIIFKAGKFYLKHNTFENEIPIVLIFKALGMVSDIEIAQLVGSKLKYLDVFSLSLQECIQSNILTQKQALNYLSTKIKALKGKVKDPNIVYLSSWI